MRWPPQPERWCYTRRLTLRALLEMVAAPVALLALTYVLYLPFHSWYAAGYGSVELWRGSHTPLSAYLVVHGLFLFVLVSWMAWETREWMAHTPLSALSGLRPHIGILAAVVLLVISGIAAMASAGLAIAPLAVPLLLWAAILFLRRDQQTEHRVVLTLAAASIALTLLVEVVVAVGDISRMNTVFKFYLQVWEILSVLCGAALAWLMADLVRWTSWMGTLVDGVPGAAGLWRGVVSSRGGTGQGPGSLGDRSASHVGWHELHALSDLL